MHKRLETKELPLETEHSKTRSRVRYVCKPALEKLMDLMNLIPPSQELKNTPEISRRGSINNYHPKGSPEWLKEEQCQMIDFDNYVDCFPTEFQDVIRAAGFQEENSLLADIRALPAGVSEEEAPNYWPRRVEIFHHQRRWYEDIRRIRTDLYRLAEIGENIHEYAGKELDIVLGIFFIEYARLDQEGRIRRQPNKFAEVMEGVEVSRIRACLVCKKLFWANRKDKRCCTEEHSSIIRQRQSRINKKEKGKIYARFAKLRKQKKKNGAAVKTDLKLEQRGE